MVAPPRLARGYNDTTAAGIADTIFAPCTGVGRAAVAIVRVSGPAAWALLAPRERGGLLADTDTATTDTAEPTTEWQARHVRVRRLVHPRTGVHLDTALVLPFAGGASYTGEPCVELHLHGGRAVARAVCDALASVQGLRPAAAGEFTRRAVRNGRMDLTAAEGVADLLNADTEAQRRQALAAAGGGAARLYDGWRRDVTRCLAHLEANIEFAADEDDCDDRLLPPLLEATRRLHAAISRHLADAHRGELVRDGVRVSIVGPPNAGKSSLLNALARRPAAIVSDVPGTTRDIITVGLDLGGVAVSVSDTAGLRAATTDAVEAEGMRRAVAAAREAHLRVLLFDVATWPAACTPEMAELARMAPALLVLNKVDDAAAAIPTAAPVAHLTDLPPPMTISCATGAGLPALEGALSAAVADLVGTGADTSGGEASLPITRARHRAHLTAAAGFLAEFLDGAGVDPLDMGAERLRLAAGAIGRITGTVQVDEVLDVIFHDFCIGK